MLIHKYKYISLRGKKTKEFYSLYLDIYYNSQRYYEFLKLYISTGNLKALTPNDRDVLKIAETILSKRLIEINTGTYGSNVTDNFNISDYFNKLRIEKLKTPSKYKWNSSYNVFLKLYPKLTFDQLNNRHIDKLKTYLLDNFASITAWSYFAIFKQVLSEAHADKLLKELPKIKGIKKVQTERQFLVLDEIKKLDKMKCENDDIKRAFLFSCFTGIRFCDLKELRHSNISDNILTFTQRKTKEPVRLHIPKQALTYIGSGSGLIFNLPDNKKTNSILRNFTNLYLDRELTFHCARHTFATLALTSGIDVYTVSKLLGHREVRTTEIYAKIIDSKKAEASKMMPVL